MTNTAFLGSLLLVLGVFGLFSVPIHKENTELKTQIEVLKVENETLKGRFIDQLLRSQQND